MTLTEFFAAKAALWAAYCPRINAAIETFQAARDAFRFFHVFADASPAELENKARLKREMKAAYAAYVALSRAYDSEVSKLGKKVDLEAEYAEYMARTAG